MTKNIQSNFKFKTLIIILLIPILLLGFFIAPAQAEWASHLVISAVQISEGDGKTNHDFIEIYNPSLNDINLKGYRLVKRTKIGTSDTSIKSWTDDAIVKAHGWRLWASSDDESYSLGIGADDATKQTVATDNGIAIRLGAQDTGEIIDSVAWGEAENIFKENISAPILGISESLVRNPGTVEGGNGEDANSNSSDFSVMLNFIPHNSQSTVKPAIENLPNPNFTPTPSPVFNFSAGTSASQKNTPTSEAGVDKEAVIGENIDFDGSDSFDSQGKELIYSWDFGDKANARGVNVSHTYNAAGEYLVTLKVDNGQNIGEDSLMVKIVAPEFSDKIILSEIFPNPKGADKDGEWIELFNSGNTRVNLRGWILASSAKTSGKQYVLSGDNFIEAKSFLVIKRSDSGLVLTNESGTIDLVFFPDKIVSTVSYGAAKEGKSYALINNAWQWSDIPTPGKENSLSPIIEKVNSKSFANISESINSDAVPGSEDEAANGIVIKPALSKNTVPESINSKTIENYLDKLISEKIDNAILKARADETASQDKILTLADTAGIAAENKEFTCKDFCLDSEKNSIANSKDVRNNPWFYGDLFLSALSLFLVWRYQEVRKMVKN